MHGICLPIGREGTDRGLREKTEVGGSANMRTPPLRTGLASGPGAAMRGMRRMNERWVEKERGRPAGDRHQGVAARDGRVNWQCRCRATGRTYAEDTTRLAFVCKPSVDFPHRGQKRRIVADARRWSSVEAAAAAATMGTVASPNDVGGLKGRDGTHPSTSAIAPWRAAGPASGPVDSPILHSPASGARCTRAKGWAWSRYGLGGRPRRDGGDGADGEGCSCKGGRFPRGEALPAPNSRHQRSVMPSR